MTLTVIVLDKMMEEEQNLEAMSDLKIHKNHLLVLDPNSVLAWGVLRSSGLVCSRAFIMDGTRLHHNQEERHIYTDVQPHQCNVLMWADCLNDARSGVVLGITDMEAIGGTGNRLMLAVPPYKKRTNFKAAQDCIIHVPLHAVANLKAVPPPRGTENLSQFIKSVSTRHPCTHSLTHFLAGAAAVLQGGGHHQH